MSLPRHALLLTAGLGTRLWPLTAVRAKPAVPLAGEPIVRRIARWLAAQGVTELVLNLHHLPATVTAVMGDGSDLGARVRYSWEQPAVLGTAGGPRQALGLLEDDPFFIVNGDTLTDVSLADLARAHAASGALVTLALVPNREPRRYGGVKLDGARVTGFAAPGPDAEGSFHFLGVQIVDRKVFEPLAPGRAHASIGGLYDQHAVTRPGSIAGLVGRAAFHDIGTLTDYWRTTWVVGGGRTDVWVGARPRIDASASVSASILWDDVEVGAGAIVSECIATDGVRIPPGSSCRRVVLIARNGQLVQQPFEG
jgi:NDP-sugar pyrophosphorylase family protein